MSETTGAKGAAQEFEAEVFRALDRYFEARRREVEDSKERGGPAFKAYEEARQQLMKAERELDEIHYRTAELKGGFAGSTMGSSEASELKEEVAELQEELAQLAEAEQSALGRKREAQEMLRRAEQDFGGNLAEASSGLAGAALAKVEEIDAFKERVDQRFAEGRTSVLEVAT